ncbi:hypothetical protein EXIGLDRAFT_721784 [Exidia glandulosa HHB12029]|uniref:Uncharacterized protein n=1 Tax=Exidia glandulosa HHB12029 TaxID=1314781 RepID=A0A165QGK1_EXIGL|nr:hypothetical protein EXIGLDRAFT_721784 [Exidia glandulosa HHB12029]
MPQSSLVNVTHIRGLVLSLFFRSEGPQACFDELLGCLPALTHLALDLNVGDDSSRIFKPFIEAVLHHIRLRRFICCCARVNQATLLRALSFVHDERVYLWCDARDGSNVDFVTGLISDAKAGRNVWEDGQPICRSDAGAAAA